jgi:hypothetical protein
MHRRFGALIVALMLALTIAGPAAAGPRHQVTIDSACISVFFDTELEVTISWTNQPGGRIDMLLWGKTNGFDPMGDPVGIDSLPNGTITIIYIRNSADWNTVTALYAQPDLTASPAWIDFSKNFKKPKSGWPSC